MLLGPVARLVRYLRYDEYQARAVSKLSDTLLCYSLGLSTLYPAYASFKAIRTKNVREYVSKTALLDFILGKIMCKQVFVMK